MSTLNVKATKQFFDNLLRKCVEKNTLDYWVEAYEGLLDSMPKGGGLCDQDTYILHMVSANLAALWISWNSYISNVAELSEQEIDKGLEIFETSFKALKSLNKYDETIDLYIIKSKFDGTNAEVASHNIGQFFVDKTYKPRSVFGSGFGWYSQFVRGIQSEFGMTLLSYFTQFVEAQLVRK